VIPSLTKNIVEIPGSNGMLKSSYLLSLSVLNHPGGFSPNSFAARESEYLNCSSMQPLAQTPQAPQTLLARIICGWHYAVVIGRRRGRFVLGPQSPAKKFD
jgi:hypothetical protein